MSECSVHSHKGKMSTHLTLSSTTSLTGFGCVEHSTVVRGSVEVSGSDRSKFRSRDKWSNVTKGRFSGGRLMSVDRGLKLVEISVPGLCD